MHHSTSFKEIILCHFLLFQKGFEKEIIGENQSEGFEFGIYITHGFCAEKVFGRDIGKIHQLFPVALRAEAIVYP